MNHLIQGVFLNTLSYVAFFFLLPITTVPISHPARVSLEHWRLLEKNFKICPHDLVWSSLSDHHLWLPDVKSWLIGKDPDAGKNWRQEEKGMTEEEMAGWHHGLSGHDFEQTLGGDGQESLACCSPWGCRVGHNLVIEQQQTTNVTARALFFHVFFPLLHQTVLHMVYIHQVFVEWIFPLVYRLHFSLYL